MKRGPSLKRGSILVFVLALIVLLGVLSMRLMKETVQELRHVSQFHRRDDLRTYAYSALDLTVSVLNEFRLFEGPLFAPAQGWGNPLDYSEIEERILQDPSNSDEEDGRSPVRWSIRLTDESGKVSLSKTKEKDLVALFSQMWARTEGSALVNDDDGQAFYDAMMDWQDADDEDRDEGAEDDYYENLAPPYFSPGKKIENYEEFKMIKGFAYDEDEPSDSGVFFDENGNETINMKDFKNCFSFYNDGNLNINGANRDLMKFLCGDDESLFEELMEGPTQGEPYYTNLQQNPLPLVSQKTGIPMDVRATLLRIEILVSKGKANFKLHAVLGLEANINTSAPAGGKSSSKARSRSNQKLQYPFRILSMRENENLID